jgi:site-specific DNA-methyltransferase (adenine-specific)
MWTLTGASTRQHPAPFPLELAYRLVRMFSFWGDTVLDPFSGTGTTMLAALKAGRNSVGIEIDPAYCRMAHERLLREGPSLFSGAQIELVESSTITAKVALVGEAKGPYGRPARKKQRGSKRQADK